MFPGEQSPLIVMMKSRWHVLIGALLMVAFSPAQEMHDHGVPKRLGVVSFPIACSPKVQPLFDRGVALLHSFAYRAAEETFHRVAEADPQCGMAHWGAAMTYFHQVWPQPLPAATFYLGQKQIQEAQHLGSKSEKERRLIEALGLIYQDSDSRTYSSRTQKYQQAMGEIAAAHQSDLEARVFYALALLADASPADRTHARQKQAFAVLRPLDRAFPRHPGIAHYLIHACDSQEMAARGLPAAKAYARIAPSAPHALHMPSHIFTRLGLWDDSIQSNLAARRAAHLQGEKQEELHAMDYLVYAYLQTGHDADAAHVVSEMKSMGKLEMDNFVVAYAATAMPIRSSVERGRWADAASVIAPQVAPAEVVALAVWSRGLGLARSGHPAEAQVEAHRLREIEAQLRTAGNAYWSTQTGILAEEVAAWSAQATGKPAEATALLRASADQEDALEKLPVTPGPILPAREQLGDLLMQQNQPGAARKEFRLALQNAPGRRRALNGLAHASALSNQNQ